MKKRNLFVMLAAAVICCAAMALVDGVIRPSYWAKSAVKAALFLGVPLLLSLWDKEIDLKGLFRPRKKGLLTALGLGLGVYAVILGGYFALRGVFDFSRIAGSLSRNAGVSRDNFLFISLYISFANSLLEELFFRGFLFLNLHRSAGRGFAYGASSLLFSLYHVAMMVGWFGPLLFSLILIGLVIGGMIFNFLNEEDGNIYPSWLVHMFANFAINTIGFMLMA